MSTHKPNLSSMAAVVAGGILAGAVATGCATTATSAPAPVSPVPVAVARSVAAPTTAAGYTALWKTLDPCQWGAADTSLSVPLADGRAVWLYSDTLSTCNGFVHSSAIVQTGGRLHVSQHGRQIIPNADARHIYWIEAARYLGGGRLAVTVAPVTIGAAGPWDFHRTTKLSRVAIVTVSAAGDLTFVRWSGYVAAPAAFHDFKVTGAHRFSYENRAHPEARLSSGRMLWTTCHNRDDGVVDFASMRPTFSER
jgi:hypothetical protein